MSELKMSLFENGKDFIERSIYSYDEAKENPKEYKYALLLLGIGTELILKRILEVEHPLFILASIDNNTKTVGFEKLIDRIKIVHGEKGRRIKEEDVKNLEAIRNIRNNIIHKEVNITEEPDAIFSRTLFTLDRMVKLFLGKTLSSTVSNWNHVVSDDTIKSYYYTNVRGIQINEIPVPCPFCSLEVLVKNGDQIKCHHCETSYPSVENVLNLIDDENEVKSKLLDEYAKEVLKRETLKEKMQAINRITDVRLKDKVINELIDSIQRNTDYVFHCPVCLEVDYLLYDDEQDHLICINCGIIESEKCHKCNNNSLLISLDGADFCLVCRENPKAQICGCCRTEIYSILEEISIDVILNDKFDLPLEFSGGAFINTSVCSDCMETINTYQAKRIIEIL